jgi:hypothetical protein
MAGTPGDKFVDGWQLTAESVIVCCLTWTEKESRSNIETARRKSGRRRGGTEVDAGPWLVLVLVP